MPREIKASYVLDRTRPGLVSLRLDLCEEEGLETSVITLVVSDAGLFEAFERAGDSVDVTFSIPDPLDLTGVDLHPVMPCSDDENFGADEEE